MTTTSNRPDGRGHWPAGKRRNPTRGVRSLLASVRRVVKQRTSLRRAAIGIEVDTRTLRRWLSGEDVPSEANQQAIRAWLDTL